jgi:hypothetical protein
MIMDVTRRSFFSRLLAALCIPIPFVFKKQPFLIPGKAYLSQNNWVFTKEMLTPSEAVKPFYTQAVNYVETATGILIPGNEVHFFLDWTPEHSELPRYCWVCPRPIYSGYRGVLRAYGLSLVTYLDSELRPYNEAMLDGVTYNVTIPTPGTYVLGPTKEWKKL